MSISVTSQTNNPSDWDYQLSPIHQKLRSEIRNFANEHIRPQASTNDEAGLYPLEILKKLAQAGFTAAVIPKNLGGSELDSVSWSIIIEEVAKASGSVGLALGVTGTATLPVLHLGTEQQRLVVLEILRGDTPGVYAQSEPEAGSDVARIRTTAREATRNGIIGWEINGQKVWISNAWIGYDRRANWCVVLAQTGEVGDRRSMRFFLVRLDTPGIEVSKINTNGMRGSGTSQIFFDHAFVPADALLGQGEAGFQTAMQVLGASRIFFSARGLGILEASIEHAAGKIAELRQATPGDSRLDAADVRLSEMRIKAAYLSALLYHVARLRDDNKPFESEVASLKWLAGKTAVEVTSQAYTLVSRLGASKETLVDAERFMRDANQIPLAEGTSEVMERILARDIARTLGSDEGKTIEDFLNDPELLAHQFSGTRDAPDAIYFLLTLAQSAYRQAIRYADGEQPLLDLTKNNTQDDDDIDSMPISPIISSRQEPLGAERYLALLQSLHLATETFSHAIPVSSHGSDVKLDEIVARQTIADNVMLAFDYLRETFLSLGQSAYWMELIQLKSDKQISYLEQMLQYVVSALFEPVVGGKQSTGGG